MHTHALRQPSSTSQSANHTRLEEGRKETRVTRPPALHSVRVRHRGSFTRFPQPHCEGDTDCPRLGYHIPKAFLPTLYNAAPLHCHTVTLPVGVSLGLIADTTDGGRSSSVCLLCYHLLSLSERELECLTYVCILTASNHTWQAPCKKEPPSNHGVDQ